MSAKSSPKFEVTAEAGPGMKNTWTTQVDALEQIKCAIPAEFNGPGETYCPEDFFAMSILNCMIALFVLLCEKNNQKFGKIKGKATLSVAKDAESGQLTMNEIYIDFNVTGSQDAAKVKSLLEQAIKDCPIGNSVKTGKSFKINVS